MLVCLSVKNFAVKAFHIWWSQKLLKGGSANVYSGDEVVQAIFLVRKNIRGCESFGGRGAIDPSQPPSSASEFIYR